MAVEQVAKSWMLFKKMAESTNLKDGDGEWSQRISQRSDG